MQKCGAFLPKGKFLFLRILKILLSKTRLFSSLKWEPSLNKMRSSRLFFNKVAGGARTSLKKDSGTGVFL